MSAVTASSKIASAFAPEVRRRGEDYYREGRVKIQYGDRDYCLADVVGTKCYEVECTFDDNWPGTLFCCCSCPYTYEHLELCKHIWATILAAQAKGWLIGPPSPSPIGAELDPAVYDDDLIEDDDDEPRPADFRRSAPTKWKPPAKTIKPDWQRHVESIPVPLLAVVPPSIGSWASHREILYVVDPQSITQNRIIVQVMYRERKSDGNWSKPRGGGPPRDAMHLLPDAADREILSALLGAEQQYYYASFTNHSRHALGPAQMEYLWPRMLQTGRCWWRLPAPSKDYLPLHWDDAGPWRFIIDVTKESGKSYKLTGVLERGPERRPTSAVRFSSNHDFVLLDDQFARLDNQRAPNWLQLFRRQSEMRVPVKEFDRFLQLAFARPERPPLALPTDLAVTQITESPRPVLHVRPIPHAYHPKLELAAEVRFMYGEKEVTLDDQCGDQYDPKARTLRHRDRATEQTLLSRLAKTRLRRDPGYYYNDATHFRFNRTDLPEIAHTLIAEGWQVEADGKLFRSAKKFELTVVTGIDWFELHGAVDFDGTSVSLPKILAALRRQQTTIDLDDGTVGMVPEEWLKKYGLLGHMGDAEADHLRFHRNQVGLLDALLAAQPDVNYDAKFRKAREEFRNFRGVGAAEPPNTFHGHLRPYQNEGLGWLQFLRKFGFGGCLADDMGLGKTVQVLAMLVDRAATRPKREPRTSLIVVPKSLIFNWMREAERFVPSLTIHDHTGVERNKDVDQLRQFDVVLTTYGTLRNDAALFRDFEFDYCILDESQAVKNSSTESAKTVRLLRSRHRLAMSGTPIENHLGELWSLFDFLNPGMLGHATAFKAISGAGRNPDPESRTILAQALRPFILRRTKDQVAKDLPQKTEQTVYCDLDEKQRKIYDDLREFYRCSLMTRVDKVGLAKSKIQVLEALLRLRQAACHPGLLDKRQARDSCAKLDVLLPRLQEVFEEGHKAIVFSQFTSFLDLVRKRLDAARIPYEYLDGRTRHRQGRVDHFQNDPTCKLFLISLKAGGVGLNLTAAEYVFLLDPWWNPAVEAQAIDRTHRIGQTRPVFAYRIIARDTVEEKVLALQNTKRALADAIINADNSLIRSLKKEDLELLLS